MYTHDDDEITGIVCVYMCAQRMVCSITSVQEDGVHIHALSCLYVDH
jgi:hypothetical protein